MAEDRNKEESSATGRQRSWLQAVLDALLALIQKSTEEYIKKHLASELEDKLKSFAKQASAGELHDRGYTEAVSEAVRQLAARTGDTNEDVLLKALALYEAALDASEKGERLAGARKRL